MSKTYALALIVLGSTILGSLIWLHFHLMGNAHANTFHRMYELNQLVIEQKSNSLHWQHQATREFFFDFGKARFSKILQVWEKGDKVQKEIVKLSYHQNWPTGKFSEHNSIEQYQELRETMMVELREVVTEITIVYTENAKAFDFSKKLLQKRLEHIEGIYRKAEDETSLKKVGPLLNEVDFLVLTSLVCLEDLLQSASNFYTGCGMTVDQYFPMIVDSYENPRVGEIVNTRIAIGTYTRALNPEHVIVVANGDTLQVCEDGLADFSFQPQKRGKHLLKLECLVTNPLTGEIRRGESRITLQTQ